MLTGRVMGTVARIVAQEGVPQPFASAQVVFLARVGEFPAGTDLVIPDRVTCRLDAQGRILDPTDPEGVRLGVELAASENVEGGFSTVVRVEGPSFTTRMFDIIVRSGKTIDIATVVRVPPDPGRVADRLSGLVDQVQEWVDDPTTLPDVGPAVEAAAGSASSAAESARQAHESALAAAGSAGGAHSDRVAAEAAAQTAAGSASTATTTAAHVDEVATTVDGRAGDAEQAATQAAGARDMAVGAAASASTSASTATTQAQAAAGERLAAQEARTGAETAQGKAETARTGAEDARDAAHGSAIDASGSASDAQAAVNAVPAAVTSALSTWFLRGNGSPVGVVKPAAAGVQYVDLAATNGARIWISTGNANTSWRVVEGDTGLRDVTSILAFPSVVTVGYARLSRTGQMCTLSIGNMNLSEAYSGVLLLRIPLGFRPTDSNIRYYNGKARIDVYSNGAGWLNDTAGSSFVYMTWVTRDAWPPTLPGTPA